MEYTLEWVREEVARLKANGGGRPRVHASRPGNARVHPNGFIQVDLQPVEATWHESHHQGHSGANLRLHIWNPPGHELPHQGTINEIHDHVFNMRSTVVKGVLTQCLYRLIVGVEPSLWTHELYRAVYAKSADSRLEATGICGFLEKYDWFEIGSDGITGDTYTQTAFTLHDSDPGDNCVVTVMEKTEVLPGNAHVVVPMDTTPDNSFDRASAAPVEYLWEAIEAAIA